MTLAPPATSAPRTHQALYRRWRAQTFGEIVGQEPVVQTLRNAVRTHHVAHALLFVGPRGTGKTSMARIVAKALNCTNLVDGEPDDTCEACVSIREGRALDVIEMDAASNNKVDDIRDFLPRVATVPAGLRRKVFIVDEVQRIKEGWDLLLKTLEEPPDHVAFIFCTTDASQVRPAVLSRIQRFDFRPLTVAQIEGKLRRVLDAEGRQADDDALALVARLAAGGMRDAESMLDQLLTSTSGPLTTAAVRDLLGMVEQTTVDAFVGALVARDARTGMRALQDLEDHGRDLRAFLNQVVDTLRENLVAAVGGARGYAPDALAAAARRLTAIDAAYMGPGGLRFQLELVLLEPRASEVAPTRAPIDVAKVSDTATLSAATLPPPSRPTSPSPGRHDEIAPTLPAEPPRKSAPRSSSRSVHAPTPAASPMSVQHAPSPASAPQPHRAPSADDEPAPVESPAGAELGEVHRVWPQVVAWIGERNAPAKALIDVCRPISLEAGMLTLGFPEKMKFQMDAAERRRPLLEEGVGRFIGRAIRVRFVATNVEAIPLDTATVDLIDKAREIFAEELRDIGEVS